MIHYSGDVCRCHLDPQEDLRYVVKMEVYAVMDSGDSDEDDNDRDHLQEIQDILQRMDDAESEQIGDDVYQRIRFDLCADCRRRFVKNPLAREVAKQFNFSDN